MLAVPTPDHCPALLRVIGTRTPSESSTFLVESVEDSSVSIFTAQVG
jgi:aromatic ring-opening dioxygenase catalytic subunit (LigB family)